MIEQYALKNEAGQVFGTVPVVQYPINDRQTILVFGGNEEPISLDGHGEVEWTLLGRLDEQSFQIHYMTQNSLERDGWDFIYHPNPFVVMGERL